MKLKNVKIGAVAASVSLVSVLAACKGTNETKSNPAPLKDSTILKKEATVFVNSDSLLERYEYFKELKIKMESKGKATEANLNVKKQAFQRDLAEYQKNANTLSADQRAATEQRLARKQQELEAYTQNAGTAFQNEQAKEQETLYNKVADYLKGYAKTKGYKMVLTYQKGNSAILYADPSLDVTKEVLEGLNAAYKKDKK